MLSVGGLPELAPPGAHRRSKSDCRLDKPDKVNDAVPLALSPRSLSPSAFNDHSQSRTRPSSPALMRSPSTSSIPEIFISGEDEHGSAMSPVTRLAVFSLADFLETVTLHPQSRRHQLHHHQQQQQQQRKKCGTGDVGGSGHGSGRRRSPLAARKSTPASGGPGGGEVSTATPAGNSVGGGGAGGAAGQAAPHQRTTSGGQTGRLSNAASHFDDTGVHSSTEDCDAQETVPSSGVSNGSGELVDALRCVTDGGGGGAGLDDSEDQLPHLQRTREAVEHIQSKIQKTKDLIKEEQKARDENVNEYLKLAANADRQQMTRIKAVFEKKNQKSAALILQLQKKLENYQKRLREIETHGLNAAHRQPKEVLRDMGQGLNHQQSTAGQGAGGSSSGGGHHGSKIGSEEGSECNSSITSESVPGGSTTLAHLTSPRNHHSQLTGVDYFGQAGGMSVEQLLMELRESREEIARLREEIDSTKLALAAELNGMREGLAEERFRCERLEEQVNDLTELHQNEMGNLVTNMTDMEEKVQYQSEERIRDLHEIVENCHTRISRMEHQQAQQQQQYLTLEGLENSNARAVFVKLINVLLTVLQVLLLVVATVANILTPLLQTRSRLIATITIVLLVVFVYIQLPELREIWLGAVERYRQLFSFV
ncbi:transmembrane and coiled-coil domains protein 1-like isoform X4 [Portunus trituberculatus]|uniref:transmembrane and coiled-coil domains protein 1-like isoform X4 n=1 Tax=Portunus trituberculatus TaxID=210409 RepID=UPI001E1D0CC8|nr:transmembrane and coiled-coil domains protein 1-like isoform X4 [Portunus trituberculatus]XP_045124121.1 transmembrane and coiled-coil domains protein 1-like isoform X4 [Portunus trituberculatus]